MNDTGITAGLIIYTVIVLLMIASGWKVFAKAGLPGWGILVPGYNIYLMCKLAGKPGWWVLLLFVPLINLIIAIVLTVAMVQKFGKGAGFVIGMLLLPFIFLPILGFGSATYQRK